MSVATVVEFDSEATENGWNELTPGPELGARLASVNLEKLSDDELVDVMAAWHRQIAWTNAGQLAAVLELGHRREVDFRGASDQGKVGEFLADEVSMALTLTGNAAGNLLALAYALAERLPRTRAALRAGRLDVPRARVIADGLLGVTREVAAAVERAIFPEAEQLTTGKLRYRVRQAIVEIDPDAAEERRERAVKGRRLEFSETPSGTCGLAGQDLPLDQGHAAYNRISAAALAMKADGDERGLDALRADLFTDLLRGIALPDAVRDLAVSADAPVDRPPAGPEARGGRFDAKPGAADAKHRIADPKAIAVLTEDVAATIARLAQAQLTSATRGRRRGTALAANTAAQTLAQALADLKVRWCTAINGKVPNTSGGHGHGGYRPPAAMRRLIQEDYGRCAFPTCRRNAARCDLDHTKPWDQFGPTCWCNLAPLCRHHHRLKQEPEWTLLQLWPGVLIWITPAGKWHLVTPSDRE